MKIFFSLKQMGFVVPSQQASNIFWHLVTCLNAICVLISGLHKLLPQRESHRRLYSCRFVQLFPSLWKYSDMFCWIFALCCHWFFFFLFEFQMIRIFHLVGKENVLPVHTLISPDVRLRWKEEEMLIRNRKISMTKWGGGNAESGRSHFSPTLCTEQALCLFGSGDKSSFM